MPLRLNVGISKKLGLPEYSSVGASCHIELELESRLLESDLDAFQEQVRDVYIACNQAVNDELARHRAHPVHPPSNGRAAPPTDKPRAPARPAATVLPRPGPMAPAAGPRSRPHRARSARSSRSPAPSTPTSRGSFAPSTPSSGPRTSRSPRPASSSTSSRPRPRPEPAVHVIHRTDAIPTIRGASPCPA